MHRAPWPIATTFPFVPPPTNSAGRRYCIVMLSAVGDAVHVLPVVNAIKRADPQSHITWILQPGPASLVDGHPAVDEIVRFDRSRGWRAFTDVRDSFEGRQFDVVLALQDYFKAGVLTAIAPAPVKLGYDRGRARDLNWLFTNQRIPPHEPQHIQDEYIEFLSALAIDCGAIEWNIGPWGPEREWQREFVGRIDRPIVSLVIGTSRPQKDWFAERWGEVADALSGRYGLQPVLVGGRSPREVATEIVILERTRHKPISALNSGLRRLVAILDASALVISLDTGPLHMAVAVGKPVISLLGFSNPLRTGPYRASQELIVNAYGEMWNGSHLATDRRVDRMQTISVADVLEKVKLWKERYDSGRAISAPNS
ncbi:MAG: glycosyltransferase family 9 protein [Gemmatimonadaceae bacterium]